MDLPREKQNILKISLVTGRDRTAGKRGGGSVLLPNQAWEYLLSLSQVVHLVPAAAPRQGRDLQVLDHIWSIPAWLGADGSTLLFPAARKANKLGWRTENPFSVL